VECDFRNRADKANFFYSTDGKHWQSIGNTLLMEYTLVEHFMGYRFGLFNYSTKKPGGFADFDYFRISDQISKIEK
jgi:beta-xylosidase